VKRRGRKRRGVSPSSFPTEEVAIVGEKKRKEGRAFSFLPQKKRRMKGKKFWLLNCEKINPKKGGGGERKKKKKKKTGFFNPLKRRNARV